MGWACCNRRPDFSYGLSLSVVIYTPIFRRGWKLSGLSFSVVIYAPIFAIGLSFRVVIYTGEVPILNEIFLADGYRYVPAVPCFGCY